MTNTLFGIESAMFKRKDVLGGVEDFRLTVRFAISYLNDCYKSLILGDDPYVTNQFVLLTASNHSPVCILHICMFIISKAILSIERSMLNVSDYNAYMTSVAALYRPYLDSVNYDEFFEHICRGPDIRSCNPNVPLFRIDRE